MAAGRRPDRRLASPSRFAGAAWLNKTPERKVSGVSRFRCDFDPIYESVT